MATADRLGDLAVEREDGRVGFVLHWRRRDHHAIGAGRESRLA